MSFLEWIDVFYGISLPSSLTQDKLEWYENKYEGDCLVYQWKVQY